MKTLTRLLALAAIVLTAACDNAVTTDPLAASEESRFAEHFLQRLQVNDFDYLKQHIDPSLKDEVTDAKLTQITEYFHPGAPLSTELIGKQTHTLNAEWQGNFSFEYKFANGWSLANVVLKKTDSHLSVVGFNVYRAEGSQRELNTFTLSGKTSMHYAILAMAIAAPLFSLITLYFCIRTPIRKRKWLWLLFILIGVGSASINWSTGQYAIQLLSVNLLSASALTLGPLAPWVISCSLPLGAVMFWIKRKGFLLADEQHAGTVESKQIE